MRTNIHIRHRPLMYSRTGGRNRTHDFSVDIHWL